MDIQKIKELALANGFKLKEQADGSMDLNAYVYDFANAIEQAAKAQSEKALLEQFEINNKLVEQIEKLKAKAQAVPEGFVLVPEHAEINLGNGLSTICDWCDFDSVNKYSWFLVKKGKVFYAATNIRETDEHGNSILKRHYLHRILFKDLPKGMVVDHLNGNGLDNRRSNLRIVSHQQNTRNRSGSQKNSKSGVRGVYWHKQSGKWAACIRHNGKNISLGLYDDLEEAKKSRLSKELEIWDVDDTYQTKAMIEAQEPAND